MCKSIPKQTKQLILTGMGLKRNSMGDSYRYPCWAFIAFSPFPLTLNPSPHPQDLQVDRSSLRRTPQVSTLPAV